MITSTVKKNKSFTPHFNSVTFFLSSVQTNSADITNQWQCDLNHTHTLMHSSVKCLYSIALFTSPLDSDNLWLRIQRGSSYIKALLLCSDETHWQSHTCCPESFLFFFLTSIWNLVMLHLFKSPVLKIAGNNLSTTEKTQRKEEETNYRCSWLRWE